MATKKEEQIAVNGVVRILELEAELAALRADAERLMKERAALRELLTEAQYLLSIPDTQLPMMELNQWAQRTNAALAPAKAQP